MLSVDIKGPSLIDHLIADPDLLNSLTGIFIRFREGKIVLSADIEAIFNQVAVQKDDQAVLRFLWRDSPGSETNTYQYQTHIFGAKCSPSCANYALHRKSEVNRHEFSDAAAATVDHNFYMDDLFKSVDLVERNIKLCYDLTELCRKGKFRLTKWISNDRRVIENIPGTERAASVKAIKRCTDMPVERSRAFSVGWDIQRDHFTFTIKQRKPAYTRRQLLIIGFLVKPT